MNFDNNTISQASDKNRDDGLKSRNRKNAYRVVPFTFNRQMMAASLDVNRQQNNIQTLVEVDISEPRRYMQEHREKTGERLSLTAFVVACLAQAIADHPHLNAFRKGNKLIILDNVTISVLVERELGGEMMPEHLGVREAQKKSFCQIQEEIRAAQERKVDGLGGLSGVTWVRFIPRSLLRSFIRVASSNIKMMERFGAVGVTAVGMFANKNEALWLIPLVGGATVGVAVGGIVERPCVIEGKIEAREHLCLTVTFNHEIVDGAPAVRFLKRFSELLQDCALLKPDLRNSAN